MNSINAVTTAVAKAAARPLTRHQALLGRGLVRHHRLRPAAHRFHYEAYFLLLPLRSMRIQADPVLARNRRALVSFQDADHGDGGPDCLSWIETLLQREGVSDADGEIWLQCFPRVLGWVFKPVSFWYCERRDGSLCAVVAEVNSTFGERHCYLLAGPGVAWGQPLQAAKRLHVSPFCETQGGYHFRFTRVGEVLQSGSRIFAQVDHHDAQGPLLCTAQAGALEPLTKAALWHANLAIPAQSLTVVLRIHWQALRLLLRGVPWFAKPPQAPEPLSHGQATRPPADPSNSHLAASDTAHSSACATAVPTTLPNPARCSP